jgi:hypothetical protein
MRVVRCPRCKQDRTTACSFSACPVADALALVAAQTEAQRVKKRAPFGSTKELARLGIKRDMRRFQPVEDRPDQFSDADERPASLLNSPDHASELGHG